MAKFNDRSTRTMRSLRELGGIGVQNSDSVQNRLRPFLNSKLVSEGRKPFTSDIQQIINTQGLMINQDGFLVLVINKSYENPCRYSDSRVNVSLV